MWFFNKKEDKPKQIELFKTKYPKFDITNTPESRYHETYITLKPINACYYKNDKLTSFVIPRFFRYKKETSWGTKIPVEQAVCIKETGENRREIQKSDWYNSEIYVVKEELNRYSTNDNFSLTLRRFKNKSEESSEFEKITFDIHDFYTWYFDDIDKKYTCAKILDFYSNMEDEVVKAFGNGLFETLKTFKELKKEMSVSSECRDEVMNYVNQIYETALSMGEIIEPFPTILDYINIKNEEELKRKEAELEKSRQLKEKQNQFIRDLKIRQSLLDDFNRPFNKEENS